VYAVQWWTIRITLLSVAVTPIVVVDLPKAIRVYIVYGTALALENGDVLFFDDIYKLDGS
jgi:murein L,D-transpeptidase YcbB/YkuD